MKLIRYTKDEVPHYGLLEGDRIARLSGGPYERHPAGVYDEAAGVTLLAPIEPARIVGVGFNYRSHILETGRALPEIPCLFMKPPTAAIGPAAPILYPRSETDLIVHYEGELAVVVGRKARYLTPDDALAAVLGYTCANDVSERISQRKEMAMGCLLVSKGWDTFCPLGPAIVSGIDPTDAHVTTRVNGEVKQSGSTSDLLFTVVDLLVYLSRSFTLLPGDVILTGSPAGVGPLRPGDVVEVEIEGIGVLTNPVELEPAFTS
jgi:2-keto-4-pentenoate hydratase/2-oxohepta-3-ene-1,7-dioic acid hydratase in catechol pathway